MSLGADLIALNLVAARMEIELDDVALPSFDPQLPANLVALRVPASGLRVLAIRVPTYERQHRAQLIQSWDWIEALAPSWRQTPAVILGDLNVSLRTPDQNGGAHFRRMLDAGWSRAPAGPTFHGPSGNPTTIDRSAGGGDDLANLTTLCAAHHQRGVHAGVIRITGRAPGGLVFETPLGRFRSGDRAA